MLLGKSSIKTIKLNFFVMIIVYRIPAASLLSTYGSS
jgi:hypothetical protein